MSAPSRLLVKSDRHDVTLGARVREYVAQAGALSLS